jgi:hypothetical protein
MKKIVLSFVFFGTLASATNVFPKPAFDGPYPAPLPTPVPQVHSNVK